MNESRTFRLLILDGEGTHVLTHRGGLPEVSIPKFQRIPPLVIAELRRQHGCDALCLFLTEDRGHVVMECLNIGSTLKWIGVDAVGQPAQGFLREALAKQGPFIRPGWMKDLRAWAGFTGPVEQHNADPHFSLLRFDRGGRSFWFKAVGEPNAREFPVTINLAKRCPQFLPHVVDTRPEWNAWITEHEDGPMLEGTVDFEAWRRTVDALAQLQIELVGEDHFLLDLGCADCRLETLAAESKPFFDSMAEVMRRQPKDPPDRLGRRELLALSGRIVELCEQMGGLKLPNSIIHGDIGPHNVVLPARGPVFLDWANAYLGQPFCSFERMMAHLRKDYPVHADWAVSLQEAYINRWAPLCDRSRATEGLALAKALTVYMLALRGRNSNSEEHDKWLRSMVRRLKSELGALRLQEVA